VLDRLLASMLEHPVIATAATVVVLGWLVVSFLAPGKQRRKIEWIAATGLYVALLGFFVNAVRRAIATDSEAGMIAFGMLAFLFGCGLVVSAVRTIQAFAGATSSSKASATH